MLILGSEIATISAEGQNGVEITLTTYGTETERRVFFNYTKDGINAVGTVYLKEEMDREVKIILATLMILDQSRLVDKLYYETLQDRIASISQIVYVVENI